MTTLAGSTHVGLKRRRNEDSYYVGRHLAAIADGMGGHVSGDVASALVIEAVRAFDQPRSPQQLAPALSQAVNAANGALRRRVVADPEVAGMGTTLVAIAWSQDCYAIASVGDSRIYRLRNGQLQKLTDDHVYGRVLANMGGVPYLDERIARFLDGRPDGRSPDLARLRAQPGDRFILCSDGLSSFVDHATFQEKSRIADPKAALDSLIQATLDAGAPDNVTVIVLDA